MCTREKDIHLQENYAARWASCLLEFLSSEHEPALRLRQNLRETAHVRVILSIFQITAF